MPGESELSLTEWEVTSFVFRGVKFPYTSVSPYWTWVVATTLVVQLIVAETLVMDVAFTLEIITFASALAETMNNRHTERMNMCFNS